MGFFDFLKSKPDPFLSFFSGGDGSSAENAVSINLRSTFLGIAAEHAHIERICGKRDEDYTIELQALMNQNDRYYDVITVKKKDGSEHKFWFDITLFYGK